MACCGKGKKRRKTSFARANSKRVAKANVGNLQPLEMVRVRFIVSHGRSVLVRGLDNVTYGYHVNGDEFDVRYQDFLKFGYFEFLSALEEEPVVTMNLELAQRDKSEIIEDFKRLDGIGETRAILLYEKDLFSFTDIINRGALTLSEEFSFLSLEKAEELIENARTLAVSG